MAIKRFTAENWEEALRLVRAEFGENAVILHSKTYKDGGVLGVGQRSVVEITASDEQELPRKGTTAAEFSKAPLDNDTKQDYSKLLEKAYAIASARAQEGGSDSVAPSEVSSRFAQRDKSQRDDTSIELRRKAEQSQVTVEAPQKSDGMNAQVSSQSQPSNQEKSRQADDSRSSGLIAPNPQRKSKEHDKQRIESLMHDVSELKELVARLVSGQTSGGLGTDGSNALQNVFQRLLAADLSPDRAKEVITEINRRLSGESLDDERTLLATAEDVIAAMVPIAGPLTLGAKKTSVICLIGPTGVGKTTTLSKLAANLLIKDRYRVGFITIDTYRLGATEQLRTLANVLDVPMRVVMSPSEMRTTIREMENLEVIFIDTAGRSHRDRLKMNELKTFLDAAAPDETHLCLASTTHPSHMLSVLDHFGSLAVDKVILTKLDEAATYGPLLEVISATGKPVSYFTTGQDIPDDIELASSERLAKLILGTEQIEE